MKTEIRDLEVAVCYLVFVLDRLLTDERGVRLLYPGKGVHVHWPDPVPTSGAVPMIIRPISWPARSVIEAQFIKTINGWQFCANGRITAPHLGLVYSNISFSPTKSGLGVELHIPDEEQYTVIANNIERLIRALRKSLK